MDRWAAQEQQAATMRSTIAWALLGLVIERPSYGYELMQRFKRTYGDTLTLSGSGRIYTALEALRARSLIEGMSEDPGRSAARAPTPRYPTPRYRATAQGVRAYEDWLVAQLEAARERQRLFAQQLAMLEPAAALEVIDRYEHECLLDNDLAEEEPETERQRAARRLADEEERLALQVRLSWIEYARGELHTLLEERAREGRQE